MPIDFTVFPDDGYYLSKSTGAITDAVLLDSYAQFLASDDWFPGLNELADTRPLTIMAGIFRRHRQRIRFGHISPSRVKKIRGRIAETSFPTMRG